MIFDNMYKFKIYESLIIIIIIIILLGQNESI